MLKPRRISRFPLVHISGVSRHRCIGDLTTNSAPLTVVHKCTSLKDGSPLTPLYKHNHTTAVPIVQRQILSLRPENFISLGQNVYDISGHKSVTFYMPDGSKFHDFTFASSHVPKVAFPSGTKGVLYYHRNEGCPEISGELRFRICDDVHSFEEGPDLMIPELWRPWRVPLYSMVKNSYLSESIVPLLLEEGLIDQSLVDDIVKLPKFQIGKTPVLYHYQQPFPVTFNSTATNIIVMTRQLIEHVMLRDLFVGRTSLSKLRFFQYRGTYLARFERAPKVAHPSLHLRFIKPLNDIRPMTSKITMAEPLPETLFAKVKVEGNGPEPWKYRIDTNSGNGKALTKFQGQTRHFKIPTSNDFGV